MVFNTLINVLKNGRYINDLILNIIHLPDKPGQKRSQPHSGTVFVHVISYMYYTLIKLS